MRWIVCETVNDHTFCTKKTKMCAPCDRCHMKLITILKGIPWHNWKLNLRLLKKWLTNLLPKIKYCQFGIKHEELRDDMINTKNTKELLNRTIFQQRNCVMIKNFGHCGITATFITISVLQVWGWMGLDSIMASEKICAKKFLFYIGSYLWLHAHSMYYFDDLTRCLAIASC